MYVDHQQNRLAPIRAQLMLAVAPLQYAVDFPFRFLSIAQSKLSTYQALVAENASLKARQFFLEAQLQKFIALQGENATLRGLLKSFPQESKSISRIEVARLLAINEGTYAQEVIVDKGSKAGVYVGQPVLDANGIMGQVIGVGPVTSRVLLITDSRAAVPVENSRNGVRAVAVGQGNSGDLILLHVPDVSTLSVGDVLMTSGLGGNYPPGYPVGIIKQIRSPKGEIYSNILVRPTAHLNRNTQVLLLWPVQKNIFIDVPEELTTKKTPAHKTITEDVG